jgi:hydroxyacylglutathione hydrolase
MMLEDDASWVIRKALRGLGLDPARAASRCGLPEEAVLDFLAGRFDAESAGKLAGTLGLCPVALAALSAHAPPVPPAAAGFTRLEMPFGTDGTVNAWLLEAGETRVLVDAGDSPQALRDAWERVSPDALPDAALLTHGHRDHIGGLALLREWGVPLWGPPLAEGVGEIKPGQCLRLGDLSWTAHDLAGHADPALGYEISGLRVPALVTGDALFAGSVGGCAPESYAAALQGLGRCLAGLPEDTWLLPGHGPASTLACERIGNPFAPAFNR